MPWASDFDSKAQEILLQAILQAALYHVQDATPHLELPRRAKNGDLEEF